MTPALARPAHPLAADDQWPYLRAKLPDDLDTTVFTCGAILRRRKIRDAAHLLRLLFGYACGVPLKELAAWACGSRLVTVTDEALRLRLRDASHWLGVVLTQVLAARVGLPRLPGLRLRLVDGTTVQRPGATGTDWRVHLTFDLAQFRLDAAEVTDAHGAEALARSTPQPGDVLVGDRFFGKRAGIRAAIAAGAHVLVRLAWNACPLQRPNGLPFYRLPWLRRVPQGTTQARAVVLAPERPSDPPVAGRFLASRLPAPEAAAVRDRLQQRHRRTANRTAAGQRVALDPRTLLAAEFLLLFTTLPAWIPDAQVVALYRLRWQVELAIKRLKSLLGFAHLTARDPALCQAVLRAKLLLAVLVDDRCADAAAFFP